jgi:hypothetical protein
VTSDEPVEGTGDGDTAPDWKVLDPHHVQLRAERAGSGDWRTYSLVVTATDDQANRSSGQVPVTVPRNGPQRNERGAAERLRPRQTEKGEP